MQGAKVRFRMYLLWVLWGLFFWGGCQDPQGQPCDPLNSQCPEKTVCYPKKEGDFVCHAFCDPTDAKACPEGDLCTLVRRGISICRASCEVGGSGACPNGEVCQPLSDGKASCRLPCDPEKPETCAEGQSCAKRVDEAYACYAPVLIKGQIRDALDGKPIEGAHVIAADNTGASATDVVQSDKDGMYTLEVPVVRRLDGSLTEGVFTLRVSAAAYQRFPFGVRPALPIDVVQAAKEEKQWTIENAATHVQLIPLPESQRKGGTVTGVIKASGEPSRRAGVLVVAEDQDEKGGSYGFSDLSGNFTIFNVPAGNWSIRGYKGGLQLKPVSLEVKAEAINGPVELLEDSKALVTVTGTINIVNAPGGLATSVVLVPVAVFNPTFQNGEIPPGLRAPAPPAAPSITGAFRIAGVPEGHYMVLAAFENDRLVRDPDPGIAGTQLVDIVVKSDSPTLNLPTSFKITEALQIISPGASAPEAVTATPTFVWKDDASEDAYHLVVFDALGNEVWRREDLPSVRGAANVEIPYAGPPLTPGMYYQFRATSLRRGGAISRTEDLLGVFYLPLKP